MCPSEEVLRVIKELPQPKNISGVTSFFGLIEQVPFVFSKTEVMLPFRHLLSPKTVFEWNDDLQEAFEKVKEEVIMKVKKGIQLFDLNRSTCLQVDWSKEGIGLFLLQKYCQCQTEMKKGSYWLLLGAYGKQGTGWQVARTCG